MNPAGLVAALAAVLACVGVRELMVAAAGPRLDLHLDRGGRAARAALRLGVPDRLSRSGLEGRLSLAAVLLAKLAGIGGGGLVAFAAAPAAPGRISLLVAVGLPGAGFLVPDALLERRARLRSRRLLGALPDACDLLAVGASSGRGTASGFAEIAQMGEGPLADELRMTVAEISCGRSLPAALDSLRRRVPGSEIATLCAAIERSHRYGSPLGDQLRRQSTALRRDQRRAVEEHAARAAPKIQLVVALILVPSVLLMITAALIANADVLLSGFA
jgi:tight adherence protein C